MNDQDKPASDAKIIGSSKPSETPCLESDSMDANRRAALAKIALLTPPVMMTLMLPARAQVGSPPPNPT